MQEEDGSIAVRMAGLVGAAAGIAATILAYLIFRHFTGA